MLPQHLHYAVQADAFEPEQWRDQLQGAVGVVSCLGAFGSNDFMLKVSYLSLPRLKRVYITS